MQVPYINTFTGIIDYKDFLVIYDGSSDQSTQIAKLSGDLGSFNISSTGNSLFVYFESDAKDGSLQYDGFHATIHHSNSYLNIKTLCYKIEIQL